MPPGTAVATRPPVTPAKGVAPDRAPVPAPGVEGAQAAGQAAQGIGKRTPAPPSTSPRSGNRRTARTGGRNRSPLPIPSSVTPHTAVVLSMIGTGVVIVVADAVDGHFPKPRSILGLGVVYIALSAMADVAPKLAVPFSALVFTGVLLTKGNKALNAIQGAVGSSKPINPYSAHDTAVLNNSVGFATSGHPGGPSLNRQLPPQRQRNTGPSNGTIDNHK